MLLPLVEAAADCGNIRRLDSGRRVERLMKRYAACLCRLCAPFASDDLLRSLL